MSEVPLYLPKSLIFFGYPAARNSLIVFVQTKRFAKRKNMCTTANFHSWGIFTEVVRWGLERKGPLSGGGATDCQQGCGRYEAFGQPGQDEPALGWRCSTSGRSLLEHIIGTQWYGEKCIGRVAAAGPVRHFQIELGAFKHEDGGLVFSGRGARSTFVSFFFWRVAPAEPRAP